MKLFIFGTWMSSLCMPDKLVTQGYITLSQASPFFFLGLLCVYKNRWKILLFGEIKGCLAWAKLGHDKVNILLEEFISWLSICFLKMFLCLSVKPDLDFPPEVKCLTSLLLSWSGVSHIARGRWGAQTVFLGEVKYTHMACGFMLPLKPQD